MDIPIGIYTLFGKSWTISMRIRINIFRKQVNFWIFFNFFRRSHWRHNKTVWIRLRKKIWFEAKNSIADSLSHTLTSTCFSPTHHRQLSPITILSLKDGFLVSSSLVHSRPCFYFRPAFLALERKNELDVSRETRFSTRTRNVRITLTTGVCICVYNCLWTNSTTSSSFLIGQETIVNTNSEAVANR